MSKLLAQEIRQTAKELNMPLSRVFKKIGIRSSHLCQWEHGGEANKQSQKNVRLGLAVLKSTAELPPPNFTVKTVSEWEPMADFDAERSEADKDLLSLIELVVEANKRSSMSYSDAVKQIRFLTSLSQ